MTTVSFSENLKLDNTKTPISVYDFLDLLVESWFLPKLEKLKDSERTSEIEEAYLLSKKSKNRINIYYWLS